jgi:uncharacterized protein (TIGR03643 family)
LFALIQIPTLSRTNNELTQDTRSPLASVKEQFSVDELSRIVEMAWEDRTPFEAIEHNFGINESAVIKIMRSQVKTRSFKLWRERVTSRNTKHLAKRSPDVSRGYCPTQYKNR